MSWNDFTERYASGSRVSPVVTLTTQDVIAESSSISWNALAPMGTTLTIETALSMDSGTTWGAWQTCTNGQSVPGISNLSSLQNVQLKIRETLTTTNVHATPELQDLTINIFTAWPNIVYGPNKSTLTAWDAISLAWKADRLSLVVNDTEACYIENPGLPAAFGSYVYIGSDRNSANAINTLVDELRLDKVYKEATIRTAWYKVGSPFYTSEEMKQWPGYMRAETDGVAIYDSEGKLRVKLGSWLVNLLRKYGLKIIGGEIYASVIQSGEEGATSYIRLGDIWEPLSVVENGKTALNIWAYGGGMLQFYDTNLDQMVGQISPMNDADGQGLRINARSNSGATDKDLSLMARYVRIHGSPPYSDQTSIYLDGYTTVTGDFRVTSGTKYNIEQTDNYGSIGLAVRESPEQKYVDEGSGLLTNGVCRVDVDPIFMECIEPHTMDSKWHIHLTPYADVGLYVAEIGDSYFVVKERESGTTTGAEFTWSLSATRKNYAHIRFMEVNN